MLHADPADVHLRRTRHRLRPTLPAVRAPLTICGVIVSFMSTALPSVAEDRGFNAAYEVTIAGLSIVQADVVATVRSNAYTVRVTYRTSGAARMMGAATGEVVSTGAYKRGRLVPATFDLAHRGSQRAQKVVLAMSEGTVNTMTIDPPITPKSQGAPITLEHLKNITDPLSALLVPAVGIDGTRGIGVCDRTVPVFDGLRRFDVTLKRKEPVPASRGPSIGPLTACALRITPVAGEMRGAAKSQAKAPDRQLGEIEMTFAFVEAQNMHIPVSLSAALGFTTLEARLTRFSNSGSR